MRFLKAAVVVASTLVLVYTGVAALLDLVGVEAGQTPIGILAPALVAFFAWGPGRRTTETSDREATAAPRAREA